MGNKSSRYKHIRGVYVPRDFDTSDLRGLNIRGSNTRTDDEGKFRNVLIVDNEEENVSELQAWISKASGRNFIYSKPVDYVSSPDLAMKALKEKMIERTGYSALIVDRNMDVNNMSSRQETIGGDVFLRLLLGGLGFAFSHDDGDLYLNRGYCRFPTFSAVAREFAGDRVRMSKENRLLLEFMQRNFKDPTCYQKLVDYYFGGEESPHLILFCGNPREANLDGVDEFLLASIQKGPGCEQRVIGVLDRQGMIDQRHAEEVLNEDELLSRLSQNPFENHVYNSKSMRVKRVIRRNHGA